MRHWDQERTDPLRTKKSNSESIKSDKKNKKQTQIVQKAAASYFVFERLVRGGEDDGGRRVPAVGDPGFGPVQDPLVALLTGRRGGGTCVAAVTCGGRRGSDRIINHDTICLVELLMSLL